MEIARSVTESGCTIAKLITCCAFAR